MRDNLAQYPTVRRVPDGNWVIELFRYGNIMPLTGEHSWLDRPVRAAYSRGCVDTCDGCGAGPIRCRVSGCRVWPDSAGIIRDHRALTSLPPPSIASCDHPCIACSLASLNSLNVSLPRSLEVINPSATGFSLPKLITLEQQSRSQAIVTLAPAAFITVAPTATTYYYILLHTTTAAAPSS